MVLSKHSNGYYYIYYPQPNGKRTSISTKTKIKPEALKFLSEFQRELGERRIQKLNSISLAEHCNNFLNYSKQLHTRKTYNGYFHSLKYLQKYFGAINLTELTIGKLNRYFENRLSTSTIYMARKDLICFNSCFNKAIEEGHLINNPCKEIKRFRIPQIQPLFFSELEFDLLLNAVSDKDVKDLVIFAIQTGLRQMELITLEWSQIDFKDKALILNNQNSITKSKRIRTVPLTLRAMQILEEREINKVGNGVFTYHGKVFTQDSVRYQFRKYIVAAKINPKLNFHSLRHSFASWLVQKGVSIFQVSKLLGHSRVETTEIYTHLRAEDLRSAIDKLNKPTKE